MATTPLVKLMSALDSLHVPGPLLLVIQFLYRYLFVVSEQAQHMRLAAHCRRGSSRRTLAGFHAAAGAVSVLFARSWERADGIYHAMLARGFTGRFPALDPVRFSWRDAVFLCGSAAASLAVRLQL
jgi:cobalt/nickel transport system permease protein